jgi:hypothetical protein
MPKLKVFLTVVDDAALTVDGSPLGAGVYYSAEVPDRETLLRWIEQVSARPKAYASIDDICMFLKADVHQITQERLTARFLKRPL